MFRPQKYAMTHHACHQMHRGGCPTLLDMRATEIVCYKDFYIFQNSSISYLTNILWKLVSYFPFGSLLFIGSQRLLGEISKRDCLACSLSLLSSKYWAVDVPSKDITPILRKLEVQCKRLGWYPGPSGQGDPHEQITWMLEKIEKQIKAS